MQDKRVCIPVCPKARIALPHLGAPSVEGHVASWAGQQQEEDEPQWGWQRGRCPQLQSREGQGVELAVGLALSSCLALSIYHAKTISLFPQREKCGKAKKSKRLMEIRRVTLPAANHTTLYSSASPIVSPPSACLWVAGREAERDPIASRGLGWGAVGRTQDCLEAMTLGVLGARREWVNSSSCSKPLPRWTAQPWGPFPQNTGTISALWEGSWAGTGHWALGRWVNMPDNSVTQLPRGILKLNPGTAQGCKEHCLYDPCHAFPGTQVLDT